MNGPLGPIAAFVEAVLYFGLVWKGLYVMYRKRIFFRV